MAFTYTAPGADPISTIRFLAGDADATEVFLQDEEISWLISTWSGKGDYYVASRAADAIASKLAREIDVTSEGQSLGLNSLYEKYRSLSSALLDQYRELLASGVTVYVGGIDAGEQPDPFVSPPAFGTKMHDNREAGNQDYGDAGSIPDTWEAGQWGEFVP